MDAIHAQNADSMLQNSSVKSKSLGVG